MEYSCKGSFTLHPVRAIRIPGTDRKTWGDGPEHPAGNFREPDRLPFMDIIKQPEFGLTPEVLRELMASGAGGVISHQVGRALLHKIPLYGRTGGGEGRKLMTGLIDELRGRLAAEDLVADASTPPLEARVPKRLRNEAAFLAALLTYYPGFLDDPAERARTVEEGTYWARIADDRLQEALLRQVSAWLHIDAERNAEAVADYRRGVRAAADGDHTAMELELRSNLIALLLHTGRTAEAELETNALHSFVNERLDGESRRFYLSRLLRYRGIIALRRADHADAILYLEDALAHADENIDPMHYGAILFALANAHHDIGESATAIELLLNLADIGRRTGREVASANAFARIGEIHLEAHDPERSREAFELAERLVVNANLPLLQRTIRFRKLPLFLQDDRIEEGIALCRELLDHYTSGPDRARILRILGLLLEKQGDLAEAESMLRNAGHGTPDQSVSLGVPLARVLIARKREEEAYDLLLPLCGKAPERKTELGDYGEGLELLSGIARRKKEYDEAFGWLDKAHEVRLSIEREKNEQSLRNARILADRKVREKKKEVVRARRDRSEEELAQLLTGLQVTHGTLLKIEERLRTQLAWLEPEQMEQIIAGLREAITDPATEQAVRQVVSEADAILALHGVDETFFESLRARWPGLTKKQQQLCGMIRAGLETPEIAHLLGITANGVLTQRKRLRKRMGLSTVENLRGTIMNIDQTSER